MTKFDNTSQNKSMLLFQLTDSLFTMFSKINSNDIYIFINSYFIHTMILNTFETTENYKIYYVDIDLNIILISILLAKMNDYEIIIICILSCQHINQ